MPRWLRVVLCFALTVLVVLIVGVFLFLSSLDPKRIATEGLGKVCEDGVVKLNGALCDSKGLERYYECLVYLKVDYPPDGREGVTRDLIGVGLLKELAATNDPFLSLLFGAVFIGEDRRELVVYSVPADDGSLLDCDDAYGVIADRITDYQLNNANGAKLSIMAP